jgi:prepilin-type N-terminal cleavage/methylation domain-containing protein
VAGKLYIRDHIRGGFTLLELLAAMAILSLLVLLMSRIFAEASGMWSLSSKRISSASEGRVIMDFLVREMSMAIADEVISFKLNSDNDALYSVETYGAGSDEVCFVAMVRPVDGSFRRTANQFVYFVSPMVDEDRSIMTNRYRLVRTRATRTMFGVGGRPPRLLRAENAYGRPGTTEHINWWRNAMQPDLLETGAGRNLETIAENVAAFEVWAWSEKQDRYVFSYNSAEEDNMLPLWVDIYLELLGEGDAARAAELWVIDEQRARAFVEANAQRYTARVYFPNRERALAL